MGADGSCVVPKKDDRLATSAWAARLAPVATMAAGAALLTYNLGEPSQLTFDEVYYVNDARALLERSVPERAAVHPPLGTWLIAAGIGLAGDHPLGWRLPGAVAGTAMLLLTYLIVWRLTRRRTIATTAAVMLATDGVFLVQARTAMLDIHLAAFVLLGVWLLVIDRQRRTSDATDFRAHSVAGPPWALLGTGVALGLAVATKWSGLLALGGIGLLALSWERGALRRRGGGAARRTRAAATLVVALAVVPAAVYLAAWVPWITAVEPVPAGQQLCELPPDGRCPAGPVDRARALAEHHRDVLGFHLRLDADHRYRASAATWLLQQRPVTVHWASCNPEGRLPDGQPCDRPGTARHIMGLGNLVLWSAALAALPVLLFGAKRAGDAGTVPLVLVVSQYLPWLFVTRPVFSFYALPLVPFLAAAVAIATGSLDRFRVELDPLRSTIPQPRVGALLRWALVAGAVALFFYFAPVWLGLEWDAEALKGRWWRSSWV